MKIAIKRAQEVQRVVIHIGDVRYRLSESVDGKLIVNKYNYGEVTKDSDLLQIFPRTSNEVELQ